MHLGLFARRGVLSVLFVMVAVRGSGVSPLLIEWKTSIENAYDLAIEIGVKDGTESKYFTISNVTEGTATGDIILKDYFANDYPNVTLYATLLPRTGQLWKDGPYWASCNVGAENPEDSGYYFWWGDTVGYKRNAAKNGWVSVMDGTTAISFEVGDAKAGSTSSKSLAALKSMGYVDDSGNLVAAHDAATAKWGKPWRMPTGNEISKLTDTNVCTSVWTQMNGVRGYLITGKGDFANTSVFIPAFGYGQGSGLKNSGSYGYYISSTANLSDSAKARGLRFLSSDMGTSSNDRCYGFPVRPVR